MKVDGAIRSLIQGVSQQPRRIRFSGQGELQENCSSSAVEGLIRRPPTEDIGALFTDVDIQQWYDYELDGKRYLVALSNGNVRVFDTSGTEYTVNGTGTAFSYIDDNEVTETTLEGVTYVSNTATVTAMDVATKSYIDTGSMAFLLGGQYGRTYTLNIRYSGTSNITVAHTTPDGSLAAHTSDITTTKIAEELETLLNADGTFTASFTVARESDVLYIKRSDDAAIEITTEDGDGGNNLFVVNNNAPSISKLPRYAPQGYVVQVQSSSTADAAYLYLEFVIEATAGGTAPTIGNGFGNEGSWLESVSPDIEYLLDASTMPHTLTYNKGTNDFTFAEGDWLGRQVGDLDSNTDPSFVGKAINYMTYFQGRLVFLSGIATIMSRSKDPYDFFLKSATTSVAADPIDMESTAKNVSKLHKAVPHNRDLVIFADNAQFIVFGRNSLTTNNSSLVLTTTFESELSASPVAAGRNILFATNYGNFTGIREFYTEGSEDINDARPITEHVLKYIQGTIKLMSTTSNFSMLLAHTDNTDKDIYVYEYVWTGDTKAQSSWSKWVMANDVVHTFFVESVIYMVVKIGDNYILEKVDLDTSFDTDMDYQVMLDRKTYTTGVNTTMSDPLTDMPDIDDMVFIQGTGCPNPGMRINYTTHVSGTITLELDMLGGTVISGIRYTSRYRPTMPFVRDRDGVKVGTGKLRVSKFFVNYRESADINTTVLSDYRDDNIIAWSGRITNDPNTVIGSAAIQSGRLTVPFKENVDNATIELWTDSHTPMTLLDIEWVGQYNKRGTRIEQGDR